MKTTRPLVIYMPTRAELKAVSPAWTMPMWWSINRRGAAVYARCYLNACGVDHELRFFVKDERDRFRPCTACCGTGWVVRPEEQPRKMLLGGWTTDHANDRGERRCRACRDGNIEAIFGAANSFIRAPGLDMFLPAETTRNRLGARGLGEPTKDEILAVVRWCDVQIDAILVRHRGGTT